MKIANIEVGKEYAVKKRSYGRRSASEHVPGMESFNPYCVTAKVLEVGITRQAGYDYEKREPKTRSNFVKVIYKGRTGYENGSYEAVIPSSNIVALMSEYQAQYNKYTDTIAKKRNAAKAQMNKAQKHVETVIAEIAKSLGIKRVKGCYPGIGYTQYINRPVKLGSVEDQLATFSIQFGYMTLLEIAEKLAGHKIDVPVIEDKK